MTVWLNAMCGCGHKQLQDVFGYCAQYKHWYYVVVSIALFSSYWQILKVQLKNSCMNHMAIPPSKYGDILQESNQILREFATNGHPKREREVQIRAAICNL